MKHDPDSVRRARESRRDQTSAEAKLWTLLRNRRLIARKFRRQYPIGSWVADFACPAIKLAIEVDGPSHDAEDQQAWDEMKTEYLRTSGWRIIRIKNADIYQAPPRLERQKVRRPSARRTISCLSAALSPGRWRRNAARRRDSVKSKPVSSPRSTSPLPVRERVSVSEANDG
jgi:very-short-patch-repair endonuclease